MSKEISRRDFLKLGEIALAAIALTGCVGDPESTFELENSTVFYEGDQEVLSSTWRELLNQPRQNYSQFGSADLPIKILNPGGEKTNVISNLGSVRIVRLNQVIGLRTEEAGVGRGEEIKISIFDPVSNFGQEYWLYERSVATSEGTSKTLELQREDGSGFIIKNPNIMAKLTTIMKAAQAKEAITTELILQVEYQIPTNDPETDLSIEEMYLTDLNPAAIGNTQLMPVRLQTLTRPKAEIPNPWEATFYLTDPS